MTPHPAPAVARRPGFSYGPVTPADRRAVMQEFVRVMSQHRSSRVVAEAAELGGVLERAAPEALDAALRALQAAWEERRPRVSGTALKYLRLGLFMHTVGRPARGGDRGGGR